MTTPPNPPDPDDTPTSPATAEGIGDADEQEDRAEERPELLGDGRVTPIVVPLRAAQVAIAGAVLLLVFVLWTVPAVITILIGGMAFALLFSFPVRVLDRFMPRAAAVAIALVGSIAIVGVAGYIAVPPIAAEVTDFVTDLPGIIEDAERRLRETAVRLEEEGLLPADADEMIGSMEAAIGERATGSIEPILTGIIGQATSLVGLFITIFGVLFVGITLLLDGDRLRRKITGAFPHRYHDDLDQLWTELGSSMSRYLGGLIVIALIQGALVSVALLLLGVPYALVLGVWVAMTSVVPYLGAWLGAIPALILAALESPVTALWTLLIYFGVQTFEGNFLTPRIQGDAVRVHPIIVLLTVVAVGSLFGIIGIVLAVPMLAVARVLFDFLYTRVRLKDPDADDPGLLAP